ncbi:hypothetical protein [Faecalibacillus intestinalis]|uniref:hypothetical protein n=1 Tax=Faecalibacillus intestinalis TaxID=1982626 RepID=UPI002FDB3C82
MKELLIDFTMVGLLLFCMNGLLNNHYIQNEMVSKNIVAFEQNVQKQKEVLLLLNKMYKNKKKLIQMKVSMIIKKIIHFL